MNRKVQSSDLELRDAKMLSFRDSKTVELCVSNACLTFGGCGGVCLRVEEPVIPGPVISQPELGQ